MNQMPPSRPALHAGPCSLISKDHSQKNSFHCLLSATTCKLREIGFVEESTEEYYYWLYFMIISS